MTEPRSATGFSTTGTTVLGILQLVVSVAPFCRKLGSGWPSSLERWTGEGRLSGVLGEEGQQ